MISFYGHPDAHHEWLRSHCCDPFACRQRGKVPIIAMTANAFAEDVQLAKNTGMNEHIAKPLDLNS